LTGNEGSLAFPPKLAQIGLVHCHAMRGVAAVIAQEAQLQIGSLLFEGLDQIDLTGPFEVFTRIPNATYRIFGKTLEALRDVPGLRLIADATLAQAPQLDLLHVPGGFGQEALMDDESVLAWIRDQAAGARCVFSVCTGALICGRFAAWAT